MDGFAVCCPLCSRVFEADGAYAAHLAEVHDLVDDEGTATTLEQAVVCSSGWAAVKLRTSEPTAPSAATPDRRGVVVDLTAVDADRIFDPRADDARWRLVVIGLTGAAILGAAAAADVLPF